MFIRICKDSDKKTTQQQIHREFFVFISCLIGQETTTNGDKMHINDIYKLCYISFGKYLEDNGRAFLLNTTAILNQQSPPGAWPEGVYKYLQQFMSKEYNLSTKEARRILGKVQDKLRANNIMRGLEIWTTFKAAQKSANVYNSSWRKLKSGENKSGLLKQIRESIWPGEEKQKNVKRVQAKALQKKIDNEAEKATWIAKEIEEANKNPEPFNPKWFPTGWISFCYLGYPSELNRQEFTCFNPPQKEEVVLQLNKAYEELGVTGIL